MEGVSYQMLHTWMELVHFSHIHLLLARLRVQRRHAVLNDVDICVKPTTEQMLDNLMTSVAIDHSSK